MNFGTQAFVWLAGYFFSVFAFGVFWMKKERPKRFTLDQVGARPERVVSQEVVLSEEARIEGPLTGTRA